jgi:hypothetical protein
MADRLPLEILSQIAQCIHEESEEADEEDGTVLQKAAAVSRKWKAAFDPFAYGYFELQSTSLYPWGLQRSNLSTFEARTSGAVGVSRRSIVRDVKYTIKIKYQVPNNLATHKISSIQKANDHGYRFSVSRLFEILKTWDNSCHLSLNLFVEYGPRTRLPSPTELNDRHNHFQSVGSTIAISDVHCISTLKLHSNEHVEDGRELYSVSAKTFLEVAHHCKTLKELYVSPRTASFPNWEPKSHNETQRHGMAQSSLIGDNLSNTEQTSQ